MKTFAKAQLTSFIGGITDYMAMIFLTEVAGLFFAYSIIFSGLIGAVVNFILNRRWTFDATAGRKRHQLPRFILIVMGSIFLKTMGTYLIATYGKIDYKIGRLMVDLVVAIGFNFPLQKYWVFRDIANNDE
jgi:putative flippase GtrA